MCVAIVAIVAFFDYSRTKRKAKKKQKSLQNLAKSYEFSALNEDIAQFAKISGASKSIMLIAQSLVQSGDNEMAINIYLSLFRAVKDENEKIQILEALGFAYFEAGFLERAKNIFTQILENYPRNTTVMGHLMQCYENLGDFANARESLSCLAEMDENFAKSTDFLANLAYLNFKILLQSDAPMDEKITAAQNAVKDKNLRKIALNFLKMADFAKFFDAAKEIQDLDDLIDLFWDVPEENFPDDAKKNQKILEILAAKNCNLQKNAPDPKNFALKMLKLFNESGENLTLNFEYRCKNCHGIFPFDAERCLQCHALGEMDLLLKPRRISKVHHEKN